MTAPATPAPEAPPGAGAEVAADVAALRTQVADLSGQLESVIAQLDALSGMGSTIKEMSRLRERDLGLIEQLHADNATLRQGEIASAMAPLIAGLVRLQDQMSQLAGGDPQSDAGMLRTLLLQVLDTAGGVTSYEPQAGDEFDSSRHSGAGRVMITDKSVDGTVARSLRPGFTRADGTTVRVADVEVYRYAEPAADEPVPEAAAAPPASEPAPDVTPPLPLATEEPAPDSVVGAPHVVPVGAATGSETDTPTTLTPSEGAAPTGQQEER